MNEILKKNRDFQKVYNNKNVAGNKIYTMFIKKIIWTFQGLDLP